MTGSGVTRRFFVSGEDLLSRRTLRGIGRTKARHKAAPFVEPMDARIGSAALEQDVVAIPLPRFTEGCTDNRAAMTTSLKVGMGYDIFDDPMLTTATQKIGNGNQHAGRDDLCICIGYKNHKTIARNGLRPNLFGSLFWFCAAAYVRSRKECKQRTEVGDRGEPDIWHHATRLRWWPFGLHRLGK